MIHLIREEATAAQLMEMLEELENYINLRPGQGNLDMELKDPRLRAEVRRIAQALLGE